MGWAEQSMQLCMYCSAQYPVSTFLYFSHFSAQTFFLARYFSNFFNFLICDDHGTCLELDCRWIRSVSSNHFMVRRINTSVLKDWRTSWVLQYLVTCELEKFLRHKRREQHGQPRPHGVRNTWLRWDTKYEKYSWQKTKRNRAECVEIVANHPPVGKKIVPKNGLGWEGGEFSWLSWLKIK